MSGVEGVSKDTAAKLVEVLRLLQKNPEALKTAQKMMKKHEEKESKTVRTTAKNFRHVMIHTQCEHCGFVSHRMVTLGKADSISYTSKEDRNIYIVRFADCKDLINVSAISRTCNNCANFIEQMDLDELRIRYWNILNNNPADMEHPPKGPKRDKAVWFDEDSIIQENESVPELTQEIVEYEDENGDEEEKEELQDAS